MRFLSCLNTRSVLANFWRNRHSKVTSSSIQESCVHQSFGLLARRTNPTVPGSGTLLVVTLLPIPFLPLYHVLYNLDLSRMWRGSRNIKSANSHTPLGVLLRDRFAISLADYDNEPRHGVECRFCGIERGHTGPDGTSHRGRMYIHLKEFHRSNLVPGQRALTDYYVTPKPGFKFLCPEVGCGWTCNRYISWAIHDE